MAATIVRAAPAVLPLLAHRLRWQILSVLASGDQRVSEIVHRLGQPANLVSYHLKRLRVHGLVAEHRSSADSRAVYYRLDLERLRAQYMAGAESLHPALGEARSRPLSQKQARTGPAVRILFLCTHNSARSQMAEGIMRHLAGARVKVFSAGNEPSVVRPEAIEALADLGIDIRQQRSKHLNEFLGQQFDYLITVCDNARESCPYFPGDPERIHWSFPDPSEVQGTAARKRAFDQTAHQLQLRIQPLLTLIDREAGR
jgi:protein-tyrosine-phosphatase/DNA-binding transcriptional ArsR family regulator